MTPRAERAVEAQRLRDEGYLYREIAERMGISISYAYDLCVDPEGEAMAQRHREARERNRGFCADCGEPMGLDSLGKGSERCLPCAQAKVHAEAKARVERWLAMRREGLSNVEIGQREDVPSYVVATAIQRSNVQRFAGLEWERGSYDQGHERIRRRHERAERIVAWWAEGLTSRQIGEQLGWSDARVTTEIHKLRKKGYEIPYRYKRRNVAA